MYVLGAVVVVLWVATALVGQLISSAANVATQVVISSNNFLESPRMYVFSISNGIMTGTHFGIALGLIGYVLRVVREVGDGDSSEGGEVEWARPSEGDEGGIGRWWRGVGAAGGGVRVGSYQASMLGHPLPSRRRYQERGLRLLG